MGGTSEKWNPRIELEPKTSTINQKQIAIHTPSTYPTTTK
jgi:hypothetical protein